MITFVLFIMLCDPTHSVCQTVQMPGSYASFDDCNTWGKNNISVTTKQNQMLIADKFACLVKG